MDSSKLILFVLLIYQQYNVLYAKYFLIDDRYTYDKSVIECEKRGAQLAVIRNEREQRLAIVASKRIGEFKCLKNYYYSNDNNGYKTQCVVLIGLERQGPDSNFTWIDGSYSSYRNWYNKTEPSGNKNCAIMNNSPTIGKWSGFNCGKRSNVLCELSEKTRYFLVSWFGPYEGEVEMCKERGAQIAVIRNEREQRAAEFASKRRRRFYCGRPREVDDIHHTDCMVYIGLKGQGSDGNFKWIEGDSSYRNWGKNEPNDTSGQENCTVMNQLQNSTKWSDLSCDGNGATALCEISAKTSSLNASLVILPRTALANGSSVTISCGPTEYHPEPQTIVLTFGQRLERVEWRYEDLTLSFSNKAGASEKFRVVNDSFSRDIANGSFSVSLQTKYWVPNRLNVSFSALPVLTGPVSCFVGSTFNRTVSDTATACLNVTWRPQVHSVVVEPQEAGENVKVTCRFDPGSADEQPQTVGLGGWTAVPPGP